MNHTPLGKPKISVGTCGLAEQCLSDALDQLANHIRKADLLSETDLANLTVLIDHYASSFNTSSAIRQALQVIALYDTEDGPSFITT